jgi:two-component system chemotaxis sensor kinase CheA
LVVAQSLLSHDQQIAAIQSPRLQRNLSQLSRITSDVQRTAMSMRMVPVDNLFRRMARLVRDVARKEGKRAELITTGNDTELDRNIVEALADPLMHMVRNAVGHGLESPEQRREAGKPETGTIRLSAYHQSGFIMIDLADDGQGLDCERILRKARERGLVPDGMNPSEDEVRNLIFEPGFSTAQKVNDVSGRGVGMDVVRKNILKLRGRVEIDSVKGRGTTFSLKVPLTLAIIEGLIVGVGEHRYIVPIYAVREMLRPTAEAMSTVQGRDEMVTVRGRLLPVVRLYRKFGVEPKSEDPTEALLLVTETLGKQFCVMVDDLIGKQEVVIKSLGESLKNISGVAGGAILGDGQVGLILDMDGIFGARKHA